MANLLDFIFGKGALDKAAGTSPPATPPAPSSNADTAGLQLAAQAAQAAKAAGVGNDQSIGSRAVTPPAHANDAALKARVKPRPTVKPQGNDVNLKNRMQPNRDDD